MAQTNFTPIQLYYSTTGAAAPTAGNLANGELAINITDGKLFYKDNLGAVQVLATKAGASGDVVGPASSTDNALVRFDTTTGKLVQNSAAILDDSGNLTGLAAVTMSGALTLSGGTANGVAYLNGSKVLTTGSALTFDGTTLYTSGAFQSQGGTADTLSITGGNSVASNSTSGLTLNASSGSGFIALRVAGDERARLTSTGLGIGTSSPSHKLSIRGANFVGASFNGQGIGDEGAERIRIGYKNGTPDTGLVPAQIIADVALLQIASRDVSAGAITFATGTGIPERMRLDSSGNLLVGATSANAQGQVEVTFNGSTKQGINVIDSSAASTSTAMSFIKSAGTRGSITVTATGTLYNVTSDYRLKTVIGPVADAGQRIDALQPVEYTWNADGSRTRGFLAHQFQEVYPSSVTGSKDAVDAEGKPIYQQMQAGGSETIADLVAEIQSLRQRLAAAGI